MFKYFGELKQKTKVNTKKIQIKSFVNGVNLLEDFIVTKTENQFKVYDRICDHAGGKIISKNGTHSCPIHNWVFNPVSGKYANGLKKKEIEHKILSNNLVINQSKKLPEISQSSKNSIVKIRFFNHAFLQIKTNDFNFATDPWAIGPAFNTGWWLKHKTKNDWISELNSCDFIYLSHNHPDHLNKFTLSKVRKDMLFLIPNFPSDSVGKFLKYLGFKKIFRAEFCKEYIFKNTNLILSLFKSGDFRDDSGIYFSIGGFTCLFDVDSNSINFLRLPKVDLYATSFAGGATGFPLMFNDFSLKNKIAILDKQKRFIKNTKNKILNLINPKYFLPYAGFFSENLNRDKFIKKNNKKNKISDYSKICNIINCDLLNVEEKDEFYFKNAKLYKSKKIKKSYYKDMSPTQYLAIFKSSFKKIDKKYIERYFLESGFKDNLILIVSLTDDNFRNIQLEFIIDFSKPKTKFQYSKNFKIQKITKEKDKKYLHIKCRKESFLHTIYNKEPWEDLSIGFQCKIDRYPNEYNVKFWYYFTNKYITNKNIRFSSECYNCDFLNQFVGKELIGNI